MYLSVSDYVLYIYMWCFFLSNCERMYIERACGYPILFRFSHHFCWSFFYFFTLLKSYKLVAIIHVLISLSFSIIPARTLIQIWQSIIIYSWSGAHSISMEFLVSISVVRMIWTTTYRASCTITRLVQLINGGGGDDDDVDAIKNINNN